MGIEILKENNGEQLIEYKLPNFINESGRKFSTNSDDYEILQVLGEGGFGEVLKVKSKTDFGIYAMKKVDMSIIEENGLESKYYENEILFLKNLDHPNIIKCYGVFKEGQYLYFIMEFMNNGDLKSYNEGNKKMNVKIEEGKLWEIFYKCLSGLDYIHKKNIIHRDIKLQNIFLDENFNVKIGDFNVSAVTDKEAAENLAEELDNAEQLVNNSTEIRSGRYKAPEVGFSDYGQEIDIYSMGASFYELCYGHLPFKNIKPKEDEGKMYSKELKDFINRMIENDPKKRPTCNEAMTYAKNYFINHYVKNTSVEATLNCFNNFPNFNNFFSDTDNINNIYNLKRKISCIYFTAIQSMKDNNISQFKNDSYELKKLMIKEDSDIKNYKEEIDPGKFIILFIRKLNSELNEILSPNKDISKEEQIKRFKILNRQFSFSPSDVENSFKLLIDTYNKKILSFISRNFFSYIKITRTCLNCNDSSCYFDKLYFVQINIQILKQKIANNNICLKDAFNSLKNSYANISKIKGIECKGCQKISEFRETKSFYHTAKNLIIIFDRGEKMKDETFIDFDDSLYLNSNDVERYNEINYKLTGIIIKLKEEYISLIRQNNIWISSKGDQFNFNDAKKFGTVIVLFYFSEQSILALESQDKSLETNLQNEQNFINNNDNNNIINDFNNININDYNNNNQFKNPNQFMMNHINNQQQQNYFNQINNNPQNFNIPIGNFNNNQINIGNNNSNFFRQNFNDFGTNQNNNNNYIQMNNNQFPNYNNNLNQIFNSNNNFNFNDLQPNNARFNQINNNNNNQSLGNQINVGIPFNNFHNNNGFNNNQNWNNLNQNNIMNNQNNLWNPMGYSNGNNNYQGMNKMIRFNNF